MKSESVIYMSEGGVDYMNDAEKNAGIESASEFNAEKVVAGNEVVVSLDSYRKDRDIKANAGPRFRMEKPMSAVGHDGLLGGVENFNKLVANDSVFSDETREKMGEFKALKKGEDGKIEEKTAQDVGVDLMKEVVHFKKTGKFSEKVRDNLSLMDALLEQSNKTEEGGEFARQLYKSMGGGIERVGKIAYKRVRNFIGASLRSEENRDYLVDKDVEDEGPGAGVAKNARSDIEGLFESLGLEKSDLDDLIEVVNSIDSNSKIDDVGMGGSNDLLSNITVSTDNIDDNSNVIPAPRGGSGSGSGGGGFIVAPVGSKDDGFIQVPNSEEDDGQGNNVVPAPRGGSGSGSGGGQGGLSNVIQMNDKDKKDLMEKFNWKKWGYRGGILLMLLFLFYLGALGKVARGIEVLGERQRAGSSNL